MTKPSPSAHEEHAVQTGVVLIPLNKLKKSPNNARKTPHAKAEIEALAASIHAKGLLQNLVVEPEFDETGARSGFFLVTIGEGRRLAQRLRAKRKQILDTEPIRCVVDADNDSLEISLDENVTRSSMSVMDEVEAFAALVEAGMSAEDVARRFGCGLRLVEQRLALARLSPRIRAAYRKGEINLDAARAFCITDDHAAQERVFKHLAKPITHAQSVRQALTQDRTPANAKLAKFVGLETYEAAGGRITRDLFEDGIAFLEDSDLLQRLAHERLEQLRDALVAEGWGWTEAQLGHGAIEGCAGERLNPKARRLSAAETKAIAALEKQIKALDAKLAAADGDETALLEDREQAEAKLDALRDARLIWDRKQMAHAGALVAIDYNGQPVITRGLIKRADVRTLNKLRASPSRKDGDETEDDAPADPSGPRLTKALAKRLTQARTRGLRSALALNSHVALALIVHVLLRGSVTRADIPGIGVASKPAGFEDNDEFERQRIAYAAEAPEEDAILFAACLDMATDKLLDALAVLLAETVDLTHENAGAWDRDKQKMSDALAAALDLDMTKFWEADSDFFEAFPKTLTLAALETAPSIARLDQAQRAGMLGAVAKMKKAERARTAAQALKDTPWLPALLVTPSRDSAFGASAETEDALAAAA